MVRYFLFKFLLLAPQLLYKNKVWTYVISVIGILVFVVYLNRWLDDMLDLAEAMARTFRAIGHKASADNNHTADFIAIISALVMFGISTVIALSKKIQLDKLYTQTTEQEKISTELSLLKAQINPHFFFNVLHTIYALADSNASDAKDAIYTLSHMMRYVIYETKNDHTTLEKRN